MSKKPTTPQSTATAAAVLPFPSPARKGGRSSRERWGAAAIDYGHCTVPSLLLQAQFRLKLSPPELNIVMQLAEMWWTAGDAPHPKKELLAQRMGISARQVQRHLTSLEAKGIIRREARFKGPKNQTSNGYDLSGLAKKINALVPEFRDARELKKRRQQRVESKAV